jgi:hypothetical protein
MSRAEQWDERRAGRGGEDDGGDAGPAPDATHGQAQAPDPDPRIGSAAHNAEAGATQEPEVVLHSIVVDEDTVDDGAGGAWCIGASSAR